MAHYAWSPIRYDVTKDKDGVITGAKEVKPGDTVTADKLGVSKDEFDNLVRAGAVRETKFPDDLRQGETPRTRAVRLAREAMEEAMAGVVNDTSASTPALEVER